MLLRIKFSKTPAGRFLSHLDLLRTMERAFRRADLALAFSEGFNPHPRISYGPALAVGVTSDGEYLDVQLRDDISAEELKARLQEAMPPALKVLEIKEIKPGVASLNSAINMARYRISVPMPQPLDFRALEQAIAKAMSAASLEVTRKGKKGWRKIDIRAGIFDVRAYPEEDKLVIVLDVQTGGQDHVRPEEVLQVLEDAGAICLGRDVRIHREGLYIREDSLIKSPLD